MVSFGLSTKILTDLTNFDTFLRRYPCRTPGFLSGLVPAAYHRPDEFMILFFAGSLGVCLKPTNLPASYHRPDEFLLLLFAGSLEYALNLPASYHRPDEFMLLFFSGILGDTLGCLSGLVPTSYHRPDEFLLLSSQVAWGTS